MNSLRLYIKKITARSAVSIFAVCCLFINYISIANAANISRALPSSIVSQQTQSEDQEEVSVATPVVTRTIKPVISRNISTSSRTAATAVPRNTLNEKSHQVGRSARSESASLNASAPVRRAGISLRPTTAEVGGRATIVGTNVQTGSNMNSENRRLTSRSATAGVSTASPASVTSIEESSAIMDSCIAQYTDCMDQFCAIIDPNQKRCACSNRLSSYERSAAAVKEANAQLNDVAQRIRYVGLSADEIRAIMSATEAELALQNAKDNTESRNMLAEIEKLIKSPESINNESGGMSLDLDIDFNADMDIADMFSLSDSTSTSFSKLRGTDLFNTAKKRCQSVLNACKAKGANISQIQSRYEIDIDRDCISYENGLEKMNQTLRKNVRSATQMLQKARLAVLDNNNTYDAKGCVGALEQCMTDNMVCGSDYSKCLDPTKRYIDENGRVVLGQNVSKIRDMMENFDNSMIDSAFISSAWNASGMLNCDTEPNNDGRCIVKYLLGKIGMAESTSSGLCRPVLEKCQKHTYDSRGKYNPKNSIVVNYIQRAMTNIRASQEKIISDYASSCMADIATCYSKQVTQIYAWSSNANAQNVYAVLKGACRNVALTCSYAVFASDTTSNGCPINDPDTCIENISDIFYQSMLCPENSTWVADNATMGKSYPIDDNIPPEEIPTNIYVNERCICQAGYGVVSGVCTQCPTGLVFKPECNINATDNTSCSTIVIGCGCPGDQEWNGTTCQSSTP